MKFLLDEDVPVEIAWAARKLGHEADMSVSAVGMGKTDSEVWDFAQKHECILITCNRNHFIRLAGGTPGNGLILLFRRATRQAECARFTMLLQTGGEEGIRGNINFA